MRLLTALLVASSLCLAQEGPPKPAPEMKILTKLVGTWNVEETHEPSPWAPNGAKGKGTATFREGPGGFSLLNEYRSSEGPMPGFHGQGMIAWDPNEKAYKSHWVDSTMPGVMIMTGKQQGESFVYTGEGQMGPQKFAMREELRISGDTMDSVTYMDGKKVMTLKYKRQAK